MVGWPRQEQARWLLRCPPHRSAPVSMGAIPVLASASSIPIHPSKHQLNRKLPDFVGNSYRLFCECVHKVKRSLTYKEASLGSEAQGKWGQE